MPEQNEQKPTISSSQPDTKTAMAIKVEEESSSKKPKNIDDEVREAGMKVMEEMPCVSTKGDGPNGRRIEGFLYRYKKGEEVRIVCVCHGSFLTPAEFVKHAGGGDVAHPLRHIVVTPSASLL
ncbi:Ninja [Thalictrum thalictroides]|uniref:Ninja-family protein n=1 Tax=Thalictrum thalictroides TaxID=46969 RepID=A0A7J6VML8_THATH|nr:Ninja [Thalictrum thalictroides]